MRATVAAAIAVVVALIASVLISQHVDGINGPAYWRWTWVTIYPGLIPRAFSLFLVFFVAARVLHARSAKWQSTSIVLLTLGMFVLQLSLSVAQSQDMSLDRIGRLVTTSYITSYWNVADRFRIDEFPMATWHEHMLEFPLHARNKPPGSSLFYLFFVRFWSGGNPIAGGIAVGAWTSLLVPAMHRLVLVLRGTRQQAFETACVVVMMPSLALIFPVFDQTYPVLTAVMLVTWFLALRDHPAWGLLTGLTMGLGLFFVFHLAVLGLPLAVITVLELRDAGWKNMRRHLVAVACALVGMLVFQGGIAWATGYDPIATYHVAAEEVRASSAYRAENYPGSILFDITDFTFGFGWAYALMALGGIDGDGNKGLRNVGIGGLTLLLTMAVFRLLPTETARTWVFLGPMFAPAVGVMLCRMAPSTRWVLHGAAAVLLCVIASNIVFLGMR